MLTIKREESDIDEGKIVNQIRALGIDMIDEAGAYVNVTPSHTAVVDVDDIEEILCSVCKIPKRQW